MGKRKGPLNGIRVIDLTTLYPGPLEMMMLGEMDGEVIRIEHPDHPDKIHLLPPLRGKESSADLFSL